MQIRNRRRTLKRAAAAIVLSLCFVSLTFTVSAENATTYTYTVSQDEDWMVTQDAYLISRVLMRSQALSTPKDIFVKGNLLYVADTGAARVIVYNLDTDDCTELGKDILASPARHGLLSASWRSSKLPAPACKLCRMQGDLT